MPVLIGPGVRSPVACRLSQPNAFAPIAKYSAHIAFGACRRQVLDAERDRVHPDAIGELVHQDFGEEASLWMARARASRAAGRR